MDALRDQLRPLNDARWSALAVVTPILVVVAIAVPWWLLVGTLPIEVAQADGNARVQAAAAGWGAAATIIAAGAAAIAEIGRAHV